MQKRMFLLKFLWITIYFLYFVLVKSIKRKYRKLTNQSRCCNWIQISGHNQNYCQLKSRDWSTTLGQRCVFLDRLLSGSLRLVKSFTMRMLYQNPPCDLFGYQQIAAITCSFIWRIVTVCKQSPTSSRGVVKVRTRNEHFPSVENLCLTTAINIFKYTYGWQKGPKKILKEQDMNSIPVQFNSVL